ncbi:uncharacterized protein E0L32_005554 [Thyridium curvatum]|uniref:Hsp90 chaperone protein kinase-targeting subunit n=1 Tax=Thyridium curvatum TaxID=1093900 RepID=A0A507BBY5_9PEZI|nr:uncharacterized protein E0L32_005554 [Thyridium curvatum]TPX14358.1 hypothetical protein E0L32_005554 [Thyridium curvatum]
MPVDYSKWDALELSDDSDIEVHPNVDKRSFIRAKQNQIHAERQQRRNQIETFKYERQINDALIRRITALLDSFKAHAADAGAGGSSNPGEVAFRVVMESAAGLKPEDDNPPPRPEGVHGSEEKLPTYTKMMATLLDQVNKALQEKKVKDEDRYGAMVDEIGEHLDKVQKLQAELLKKLDELEKEESKKITSESIHTGFDSSHVNKSKPSGAAAGPKQEVELLNPNFSAGQAQSSASTASAKDDDEMEASPAAQRFAQIKTGDYQASMAYLSTHPEILTEKEYDGLLVLAFDASLEDRDDFARQCVHQALLIQYCRALGRDGVALFFKRITTQGHQAREVFYKDFEETYRKIKSRTVEINAQRARDAAEGKAEGVEQIQLHAVEPGTVINISIPPADSTDEGVKTSRDIFETFAPDMQKALETGSLDEVNKVLGNMSVEDAEELVGKLGDSGILSLEEEIIDATTEEGRAQLKQMERENAVMTSAGGDLYPDPE